MNKQDELLKRLLITFTDEAHEHIQEISSGLVEIEKEQDENSLAKIIEIIYRGAHSLKGAARAVNMKGVEIICQSLEDVFAGFKRGEMTKSPEMFDKLHKSVDAIRELVDEPEKKTNPEISDLLEALSGLSAPPTANPEPVSKPEPAPTEEQSISTEPAVLKHFSSTTVRIPAQRLDTLLLQAEELLSAKLAAKRHAGDLLEISAGLDTWAKRWSKIQSALHTAERIFSREKEGGSAIGKIFDFLGWNSTYTESLRSEMNGLAQSADADARFLTRMVEDLLGDIKQALMLPFSSVLDLFPKMMRDLSRERGKEIELILEGTDVEIDKRILDALKDPLIHLLRNSVDHGIEEPEKRRLGGKPECGRISIKIRQVDGTKAEIIVSDDGAGIDADKVKTAVFEAGHHWKDETADLQEKSILDLLCLSGVTTSPIITDISGRGLGLAIVREEVEELGGTISLTTQPGIMTSFRILLPLTLSSFRGVLIKSGGQEFIAPAANIKRVLRLKLEEVSTIENRDVVEINGKAISLVRLSEVLELPRGRDEKPEFLLVVIFGAMGKQIAFSVDEIQGEQEVLIKKLGPQLARVRNIAGAMIQSTGNVVPVLNVQDLLRTAVNVSSSGFGETMEIENRSAQSILIAEDSITSRTLLKNILESAGYAVTTAVDGVDAMTILKTKNVDLLVSDIQMPRLDGIELTRQVRSDGRFSELPVVLVTSLSSREDRERGVDAGANAYIVKSSFDQNNLLETVERLI
jgi:two-component system, chemotaxis family, sensor kinase CheA